MTPDALSRRSFLVGMSALAGSWLANPALVAAASGSAAGTTTALAAGFPRVDLQTVETFVGLAHSDLAEVRRMVERQPALARASWDWGFGDWETGLGAAAHTGRREIADLLLVHGAHPTIFSAAMLGQLDVVRAIVAARPGIQGTLGPHGLTLLHHARVGGKDAEAVVAYLESAGGADRRAAAVALDDADRALLVGRYRFGPGASDLFDVDVRKDVLGIQWPDSTRRVLTHTGDLTFFPSGVPSVRITFKRSGPRVTQVTIADPDVFLTALREA